MWGMFAVRSSPCPAPNLQSSPFLHAACTAVARRLCPRGLHHAPHRTPSLRLGRAQTPCPTPTSCSSVARGRAPRPSPLLATARAGVREAARQTEALYIEGCVTGYNLRRPLARPQPAICVQRKPTPT
eukprot:scaffold72198_cov60-Phaeocystis_antarctica.AAC.4